MKDMGKLVCYDQDQVDELFKLVKDNDTAPDAALIEQMGSLAGETLELINFFNFNLC